MRVFCRDWPTGGRGLVKAGLAKRPEKQLQTAAAPAAEGYHQCPDTHREN